MSGMSAKDSPSAATIPLSRYVKGDRAPKAPRRNASGKKASTTQGKPARRSMGGLIPSGSRGGADSAGKRGARMASGTGTDRGRKGTLGVASHSGTMLTLG